MTISLRILKHKYKWLWLMKPNIICNLLFPNQYCSPVVQTRSYKQYVLIEPAPKENPQLRSLWNVSSSYGKPLIKRKNNVTLTRSFVLYGRQRRPGRAITFDLLENSCCRSCLKAPPAGILILSVFVSKWVLFYYTIQQRCSLASCSSLDAGWCARCRREDADLTSGEYLVSDIQHYFQHCFSCKDGRYLSSY